MFLCPRVRLFLLTALAVALPLSAAAQVTITSPTSGQRLKAGPDYGTDVLADPMDMNNTEDISPDPLERPGWSALTFANGRLTGTTAPIAGGAADSSIAFLYRGFYGLVNPGRNGMRFPIDPNAFRKLSFKMSSTAAGENVQIYWFHQPLGDPAGVGLGVRYAGNTSGGDQIFTVDLAAQTVSGEPWNSALVRGFRIDPNSIQTGQQVSFDWVRLTAADGAAAAAMHTITWSGGSGTSTIEVVDAAGTVMTIATGVTATSFAWNYGVLPPGAYTLRVRRGTAIASQAFSINNPPVLRVTDPDLSGGADFGNEVIGNAWDMSGPPDIVALQNATGSYSGNFFHGTSDTSGDPGLWFVNQINNARPIDSTKYRYLTFDLQVDGTYDLARGSVARVFWGSQTTTTAANMTTSRDIIVFPGMNHYSIDLGSLSATATGGIELMGAQQAWNVAPIRFFRIDPHELPEVRTFHIGPVKLARADEAAPTFTIRWAGSDPDGDPATVSLYYDTNTNPGDGMTLIASGVSLAAGAYTWNAAAVPTGTYYVHVLANDGIQQYGGYSSGTINVNGGGPGGASDVVMSIDTPANWASVSGRFTVAGWALDRGAATGNGVDAVHVYAYPNPGSGAAPLFFGGVAVGGARGDVGAAFGAQFTNSGWGIANSLPAGNYQLVAFAHSTVTGTFSGSTSIMVNVVGATSAPRMALDSPGNGQIVFNSFGVGGWAIDTGAASGTGVDAVHVYAYPNPGSGAAPLFLGVAAYGAPRGDIANAFGARFQNSGYNFAVSNLAPGAYQIVAYAHSTVTGTFNNSASSYVRVSVPIISLDKPLNNSVVSKSGFAVAGWAVDLGAPTGTGIDAVHVWAYPTSGAAAIFAGVASYGAPRADVGSAYGQRFTNSGFNLTAGNVPAGVYDLVAYAHSTVTGTFATWRIARVTVQ
jgi:hypothetical protein